jgi:hypothetical protein
MPQMLYAFKIQALTKAMIFGFRIVLDKNNCFWDSRQELPAYFRVIW